VEAGSTLPYSLALPEEARWNPELAALPRHVPHLLQKPLFLWTNVIQQALQTTRAVLEATKLPMDNLWVKESVMSSFMLSVQFSFFFPSYFSSYFLSIFFLI
jgi:hypothetical protein